jgi:hypothetical protein
VLEGAKARKEMKMNIILVITAVQTYTHTFATAAYCSFYRFEKDRR